MAATYEPTFPAERAPLDRARYALGDTGWLRDEADAGVFLLEDETIQAQVAALGYNLAVAELADGLRARFSQEPSVYWDEAGARVEWPYRLQAWADLAKRLRASGPADATVSGGNYQIGKIADPAAVSGLLP